MRESVREGAVVRVAVCGTGTCFATCSRVSLLLSVATTGGLKLSLVHGMSRWVDSARGYRQRILCCLS